MKRDNPAVQELAEAVFAAVESYLDVTLRKHDSTALGAVMAALDERLQQVPAPERGERGLDGASGASAYELAVRSGFAGTQADWLASLRGPQGAHGADGKSLDIAEVEPLIARAVDALPRPRDGKDGADGRSVDPAEVEAMVRRAVESLPKPADGIDGRDGRDGEPGRDAWQIDVLPEVDVERSYARGTVACWQGGIIRAVRTTDPVGEDIAKAGWQVLVNGPYETVDEQVNERTVVRRTSYTDGRVVEQRFSFPTLIDRGVWREGRAYERGDGVTWGGSFWIAQRDTTDKPGDSDAFRLAVKRGRDGRDSK